MIRVPLVEPKDPAVPELGIDALVRLWRQADAFPQKRKRKATGQIPASSAPAIADRRPMQILEPDEAAFRKLAVAVVFRALQDLYGGDLVKALDAVLWLSGDGLLWLDGLGLPFVPMLELLAAGKVAGQIRRKRYLWMQCGGGMP